jgi:hypothetical protein
MCKHNFHEYHLFNVKILIKELLLPTDGRAIKQGMVSIFSATKPSDNALVYA